MEDDLREYIEDDEEDESVNLPEYSAGSSPAAQRGRQKRIERRKNKIRKFFRGLFITIVVLAVLAVIFIFAFRLKNFNVIGNSRYSKEDVVHFFEYSEKYENTILFYIKYRNMSADNIPFVEKISIGIGRNDTIDIEIMETEIAGCFKDGGQYVYIDTSGVVCEISDNIQENTLLINGLDFEETEINKRLNVTNQNNYNTLLNLTILLNKYELDMDELSFNEDGTMVLKMGDIQILLGNALNLEDKITELANLTSELEGLKGILHLENYDSSKDSIIFTKE